VGGFLPLYLNYGIGF